MGIKSWAVIEFFWEANRYLAKKAKTGEKLDDADMALGRLLRNWNGLVTDISKARKQRGRL